MRRPRAFRPQRAPIFIGCEGECERGYVVFLGRLAEQAGLAVHLDAVVLQPGGGDPLAIVEQAEKRLSERKRTRNIEYHAQFVLIDRDKWGNVPERDAQINGVATRARLTLLWQAPCHEAILLRHLENCTMQRPQTTPLAETALVQRWPEYKKPMDSTGLARRLDLEAIKRVASVELDFARLFQSIGFLEADG